MLKVTVNQNEVLIVGGGMALLKVKTALANVSSSKSVGSINKNTLVTKASHYLKVRKLFPDTFAEDAEALKHITEYQSRTESHEAARLAITNICENGQCVTGNEHWDSLLDPHQGIAANVMSILGLSGMCLFDEQGTGKTISALAAFDLLRAQAHVSTAVIVAPKTLLENWRVEIEKFLPTPKNIVVIDGDKNNRYKKLTKNGDIYLATYETLSSELVLFSALAESQKMLLIVDESFFVKNPDAARSQALRTFRHFCTRALVLCGTPAPNSPADLIHQFDLSDNGYTFGDVRLPKDPEELKTLISERIETRGIYLRRTKESVLPDLPDKTFNVILVDMAPRQAALYEEARNELALYLKTLDNRTFKRSLTTYFQKRAAMLQICISARLIDHLIDEDSAKYLALDTFLRKAIEEDKNKVVVWSVYTKTIDDIFHRYQKYSPARVDGQITDVAERQLMVERFQTDPETKLFIGNPAAAGAGITLHASHIAVYLSFSNQAAHYMQSVDRIHRRGQVASSVEYHFIVCRDTIEQVELARLSSKQATQADLLGDVVNDEFSLEAALREIGEPTS